MGVIYTDLAFLNGVKGPCEVCDGKRFKDEVLGFTLNGNVGLEYLTLGQPLSTLSEGECQRIKLASELHKNGSIYVMDEPTTGLHVSDIAQLPEVINRLVDSGNTVIVIEHNLHVIKNADWIIDMGLEGGSKRGTVMFAGTPIQRVASLGNCVQAKTTCG